MLHCLTTPPPRSPSPRAAFTAGIGLVDLGLSVRLWAVGLWTLGHWALVGRWKQEQQFGGRGLKAPLEVEVADADVEVEDVGEDAVKVKTIIQETTLITKRVSHHRTTYQAVGLHASRSGSPQRGGGTPRGMSIGGRGCGRGMSDAPSAQPGFGHSTNWNGNAPDAPHLNVLHSDRPYFKPAIFVPSVLTRTLFDEDEETLEPAAKSTTIEHADMTHETPVLVSTDAVLP
ncbi:hypothetical protein EDB19DRAFT_1828906 [Suillus lakei]|nr:hypothetical protein EDB19DRAFT_1828906 [Suillus lakei]